MKIALCIRRFTCHGSGGMEHACANRANELAKQGHDVHLITSGCSNKDQHDQGDFQLHCIPAPEGVYSKGLAEGMEREVGKLCPDILHLDSFDGSNHWWLNRPGKPRIIAMTMHGISWGNVLTQWNEYRLGRVKEVRVNWKGLREMAETMHSFDRVLAVSCYEQFMIQQLDGRLSTRLVYNAIAPSYFTETKPIDLKAPFMAFGSRWPEEARLAAKECNQPVDIITGISRANMPETYDNHRGLILPNLWAQGFDMTIAESLARRRPVLAYASGSLITERLPGIRICEMGRADVLGRMMVEALPEIPDEAASYFQPWYHVGKWLEATQ